MEQPQQPPRPQSPWQQNTSPTSVEPPYKRAKLSPSSPASTSPFPAASATGYSQSPTSTTPYPNPGAFNHVSLPQAYNQQRQSTTPNNATVNGYGIMGPPKRPLDARVASTNEAKQHAPQDMKMDINDLSDVMTASGINIREEEEFIARSYYRPKSRNPKDQAPGSRKVKNEFDLTQNTFASIGNRGHYPQGVDEEDGQQSEQDEEELYHKSHARVLATRQQKHLADPFLWGNCMRVRLERIANLHSMKVPMEGLFDKIAQPQNNINSSSIDSKQHANLNTTGLTPDPAVKAPSKLTQDTPLYDILSLLGLAAGERIRGLMEDAIAVRRSRQTNSDGVVPPEWADIATGVTRDAVATATETVPEPSITGSSWDTPVEQRENDGEPPSKVQKTTSFSSDKAIMTQRVNQCAKDDRKSEEERMRKRKDRKAKKEAAAAGDEGTGAGAGSDPSATPGPADEKPLDTSKSKKKDRDKAKLGATEEAQTRAANQAATMALGNTASKYSWMTSGTVAAKPSFGLPKKPTTASGTSTPGSGPLSTGRVDKYGLPNTSTDKKIGTFKEANAGKKVELRDWICALEEDGHEFQALFAALSKQNAAETSVKDLKQT